MRWALGLALALSAMASAAAAADNAAQRVRAALENLAPALAPDSVQATPVDGLYAATIGAQVVYVSADGGYLLRGDLVDLSDRTNLTEHRRRAARVRLVESALDRSRTIVFAADAGEHSVTVFTDVGCPYCRKLHAQIEDYRARGITVRYLAFPRGGAGSRAYDTMAGVWCADDRQAALTRALAGRAAPHEDCESPIADQVRLARRLGVSVTPTIVLPDGRIISGYRSPRFLDRVMSRPGGGGN